jgi:hypothetical protein
MAATPCIVACEFKNMSPQHMTFPHFLEAWMYCRAHNIDWREKVKRIALRQWEVMT